MHWNRRLFWITTISTNNENYKWSTTQNNCCVALKAAHQQQTTINVELTGKMVFARVYVVFFRVYYAHFHSLFSVEYVVIFVVNVRDWDSKMIGAGHENVHIYRCLSLIPYWVRAACTVQIAHRSGIGIEFVITKHEWK